MSTEARDDTYAPPALLLDGKGGARPLDRAAFERWRPEDGPVWIQLDEDSERDRAWLETAEGLGKSACELFLCEHNWPRARVPGTDQLFLLMRVMRTDSSVTPHEASWLRFWIEPRRVITMGPREIPNLRDVRERLDAGKGPDGVGSLLLIVTEFTTDRLADDVLRLLRPALFDLELSVEKQQQQQWWSLFDRIHRLLGKASVLRSFADPQRALLLRLRSLDLDWLTKDHANEWHSVIEYHNEASRELDTIVERIQTLEGSLANRTSEQINRRIYTLTVISTLILPLSLIAGVLGMNVSTVNGNILDTQHPLSFIVLCIGLVLAGWGIYVVFRRLRLL